MSHRISPFLQRFGQAINVAHFSIPLSILLNAEKRQSYDQILLEQFSHRKHLFIAILLALSHLIISFLFEWMKSDRNPLVLSNWFYALWSEWLFWPMSSNYLMKKIDMSSIRILSYKRINVTDGFYWYCSKKGYRSWHNLFSKLSRRDLIKDRYCSRHSSLVSVCCTLFYFFPAIFTYLLLFMASSL